MDRKISFRNFLTWSRTSSLQSPNTFITRFLKSFAQSTPHSKKKAGSTTHLYLWFRFYFKNPILKASKSSFVSNPFKPFFSKRTKA